MSATLKEYQFFRSFSAKIENWPLRKAEAIWRKMRERKIAGEKCTMSLCMISLNLFIVDHTDFIVTDFCNSNVAESKTFFVTGSFLL